jgi:hypothetical protein
MGGFYGYDPSLYRTDFSWLGDIGAAVSKAANAFPELWDLNQQIKENRFFKQKTYTEILEWIDWLDDTKVTNIASSMGLQYDPNDPQQARNLLKQQILDPSKLSDKLSNEDYVKRLAIDSIAPIVEAAKAKANGVLTEGDLFAGFKSGVTREAFKNYTTTGKAMMEDAQYKKMFDRRFGRGGEMETELGMRNQFQLDLNQKQYDVEQQRSSDIYAQVDDIMSMVKRSDEVWSAPGLDQYDPKAREKAYETLAAKEANELRLELKDMDQRIRELQSTNKPVSVDVFDDLITSIDTKIYQKGAQLDAHLKNKDAKKASPNIYNQQTEKIKRELEELKIRQKKAYDARDTFLDKGQFTTQSYNEASKQAEINYETQIKPQEEKEMIDLFNNNVNMKFGGFSGGGPGRGDDLERFISAYKARFGVAPVIKDGKPIPQFGGSTGTQTTPGGGINLRISPSTKKTDDDLIKEILGK